MTDDTFKSRLARLIQKSKKAIRIYNTAAGPGTIRANNKPFADQQIQIWREVNESLLSFLTEVTKQIHLRQVAKQILKYAENSRAEIRKHRVESEELHAKLLTAANKADYVNSSILSSKLLKLKTSIQAKEAVFAELEDLLNYANIKLPVTHQDDADGGYQTELAVTTSKIIPFRKKEVSL